MIQAIVLAAGRSTRMGEQKLLLPFNGMPMVDFVTKTVLSCGFDGISIVVSRETMDCIFPIEGANYIVNPNPDHGQDSSFHCALSVLPKNSSFAVFLADKPTVTARQIMALRSRFKLLSPEKNALVPRKNGAPGHPSFYSHLWKERFLNSSGASKAVLFQHEKDVEWVEFDDHDDTSENLFFDVDTQVDYRRLVESIAENI